MKLNGKIRCNSNLYDFEFEGTPGDIEYLEEKGIEKLKKALLKIMKND